MDSSQYQLTKDFFSLLHINISTKHFYSKKSNGKYQESTIPIDTIYTKYLGNKRHNGRIKNLFFYVNEGNTVKKLYKNHHWGKGHRESESRKREDRIAYNAFYFDIDFKSEDNKHLSNEDIQLKKIDVLPKLKNLYPTAIIESRNGYHVYFSIHPKDRTISESMWKDTENQILNYIYSNVTQDIDTAVKDGARILRIPYSFHKKDDSELFQIKIEYLNHKRYLVSELLDKFPISILPSIIITEKTNTHDITSNSEVVTAIRNLDSDFFNYIPKIVNKYKTSQEVANHIKSYDMFHFLQIEANNKQNFNSIFRDDKNPSAFIDTVTYNNKTIYFYNDLGLNGFCKDVIGLVEYISETDRNIAFKFLCDIFFEKDKNKLTTKPMKQFVNDNTQALLDIIETDSKLKYMKKLIPTYKCILDMFSKGIGITNVPKENYILEIGQEYISKTYGIPKSNAIKHIMLLYHLGIIERAEPIKIVRGKTPVNTCYIRDLTVYNRYNFILRSALNTILHIPNIYQDVTKTKLQKIELAW